MVFISIYICDAFESLEKYVLILMDIRRDRVFKITDAEFNLFSHADFHWMVEKRERVYLIYRP